MNARRIAIVFLTVVLIAAVLAGVVNALEANAKPVTRAALSNVRDFAPALVANGPNYAIDGGALFAGGPGHWVQIRTPQDAIVGSVAADRQNPGTLYIGAANDLVIYRSTDKGSSWLRVPLSRKYVGGVTDIAVDSAQRLLYVGTDTAGVFRLRDVGSSVIVNGQLLLDEPVVQVAADSTGLGMAFARTPMHLYRAENYGLSWVSVDDLHSVPTALAIANTRPAKIYVGTVDRGLLESTDGRTWTLANQGLGLVPGSRLQVDALAIDPLQPNVMYVGTSYVYGTTEAHVTPVGVAMSTNGAQAWAPVKTDQPIAAADLMPVSGQTGAVYVLTNESRTPLTLGKALAATAVSMSEPATTRALIGLSFTSTALLSWLVAALAAMALAFTLVSDLRRRRPQPVLVYQDRPSGQASQPREAPAQARVSVHDASQMPL